MNEPDTDQLLTLAHAGDSKARQQLLVRYQERLRRMITFYLDPRLSARVDPSDVLQEAMTCAIGRLSDYLENRPIAFYPWLRAIVRQAMIDNHRRHVRAQRRSVYHEEQLPGPVSDTSAMYLANQLFSSQSSPSHRLNLQEAMYRVKQGLETLSPSDRDMVLMRCVEQMSTKEITEVLGITESAAKSRIRRALQKLARIVGTD